jgi:hypothetical protein
MGRGGISKLGKAGIAACSAILILLPIAAAAIGMTAFVIAFYIAEKGVQICRRYSITSSAVLAEAA